MRVQDGKKIVEHRIACMHQVHTEPRVVCAGSIRRLDGSSGFYEQHHTEAQNIGYLCRVAALMFSPA